MEVDDKYEVYNPVGYGAYGVVCAAVDTKTGKKVAIKKVPKVFVGLVDGKRVLREIKLLPYLRHENVMSIVDLMRPREGKDNFNDLYIVSELMEADLHQVIRSKQKLTPEHHQYFIYQILRALKHIHSAGVIHRDLKPGNILVNGNCDIKICDFGLARGGLRNTQNPTGLELTDYVVTRWYRPPELLLSCNYNASVDLWSLGCIIIELINRKAAFPGKDYINQLALITDQLGAPSKEDACFVSSAEARSFMSSMARKPAKSMSAFVPHASKSCIKLIQSMLSFNPNKRITAANAMKHEYLTHLYDSEDDVDFPLDVESVNWGCDDKDLGQKELRALFWKEIQRFHPN